MPGRWGTPAERLWRNVEKSDRCWLWLGSTNHGYGQIKVAGIPKRTHRLVWELTFGPIPDGLDVCHHCDRPPCVRPDHLFLGTALHNAHDKIRKGRAGNGAGIPGKVVHRKLTDEQIIAIRQRYQAEQISTRELGREYDVHFTTIVRLINGTTWREIGA